MPAKDYYHDTVCHALVQDGWTITDDPYRIVVGPKDVYVDLGAERVLAASKGQERIAVEIKSFRGASDLRELEVAVGQYAFYRSLIQRSEPDRKLYLAVPFSVYENTFQEAIARPVLTDLAIAVLVFDPDKEVVVQWTK